MSRRLWIFFALLTVALAPMAISGQAPQATADRTQATGASRSSDTGARPAATQPPNSTGNSAVQPTSSTTPAPTGDSQDEGSPDETQTPRIVVTTPAPQVTTAPWTLHERIAWGANIVLAVLGYVVIMLLLRLFKNIRSQTEINAATAQAALDTANAVLAQSKAILDSERPWIVVTVEPFLTMENSFKIIATNRGRTPARVLSVVDRAKVATDETQLPESPEYAETGSDVTPDPMVLLPGETAGVLAFSRDDVGALCKSDEERKRIELWQESIFLYGRIIYKDMITPAEGSIHETSWCCRYIHGEKNSAMVIAGPPLYNQHT